MLRCRRNFDAMLIMTSTTRDSIICLRISNSEARASAAEFAITKPALPVSFSGTHKQLYPNIISIIYARHAERESWIVLYTFHVNSINIKGWIRHHKVKFA